MNNTSSVPPEIEMEQGGFRVNTKRVQAEAIRSAYMAGFLDAMKPTPYQGYGHGRYSRYYDAGRRFGNHLRREAQKMADHYARDYVEPMGVDTTSPTEPPPTEKSRR